MKKLLLIVSLLALSLSACIKMTDAQIAERDNRLSQYERGTIELMGEVDGCKTYKVSRQGYYTYFTKCETGTTSNTYRYGKRDITNETQYVEVNKDEELKQKALAKLTPEEKELLGLK